MIASEHDLLAILYELDGVGCHPFFFSKYLAHLLLDLCHGTFLLYRFSKKSQIVEPKTIHANEHKKKIAITSMIQEEYISYSK